MFLFFFYTWILSCQCIVRLFLGILVCGIYVLYMFRSEKFQESSHLFCSKCISLRAQFKDLLLYYTAEPSSEGRWEKILFSGCVVFCFFFFNETSSQIVFPTDQPAVWQGPSLHVCKEHRVCWVRVVAHWWVSYGCFSIRTNRIST